MPVSRRFDRLTGRAGSTGSPAGQVERLNVQKASMVEPATNVTYRKW
ncbi:MAG: hypothetical protein GYA15_03660 [Leptolinea sp.]|nr:hypothetical protein [Leptolinea sp.]